MKIRPIFFELPVLLFLFCSQFAFAIPYQGEETFTYRQPDGATFGVKLYGDEFFAYQRTLDGREVVRDAETGFWCYANLSPDGRSFVSSGIPVVSRKTRFEENKSKALASGIAPAWQTLPPDVVMGKVRAAQRKFHRDDKGRLIRPSSSSLLSSDAVVSAPPARTTVGDYTGLVILVDFPDQPGTITPAQVDNFCNQPSGYTEFGNACSVNEYYRIQSNGKLNFCNSVTAYVRMPKPKSYYDDNQPIGNKARELVDTALSILIEDNFDFSKISRDSTGAIYSLSIFYAGDCASAWSNGLWPHSWVLSGYKTVDPENGIYAWQYQMSDMGNSLSIGTFCHENGHMTCQFPDLYSYVNGASIVGYYSLMSSGSHGGGGLHPTNIDPYLKIQAGWADVVDLTSSSHLRALAQVDRNFFYRFRNPSRSEEYFLVENRNASGYEGPYGGAGSAVNPGTGLAVWQILESGDNAYSSIQQSGTYTTPYEAFIIEATPDTSVNPWYSKPAANADSSDTFYPGQGASLLNYITTPELDYWSLSGRTTDSQMVIRSFGNPGSAVGYTVGSVDPSATSAIGFTTTQVNAKCSQGSSPSNAVYNLFNAAGGTLNYTISDNAAWLSCSPPSGSATTEADPITVSVNSSALAVGTHWANITITASGASNSPLTIPVALVVESAPTLSVSTSPISESLWPGQTSDSKYFVVENTGGGTMAYTVTDSAAWLTPSVASGTAINESDYIFLSMSTTGLSAGTQNATVTVTAAGVSGSPKTVNVALTVKEGIQLSAPNGGENWIRGMTKSIAWETSVATNIKIELLKGGVVDRVIASSTANDGLYDWLVPVNLNLGGDYRIRITTIDQAYTDQSDANFAISDAIYTADMTTNPGWTLGTGWAWGQPTGGGDPGYLDPTSGYTGSNVIGYNLSGDYENDIENTHWATTPAFNCSNTMNIKLSFYRWLGVEDDYDSATIQASNNGTTWVTIWENNSAMIGGQWEYCEYDISGVAAGKSSVRVRFGMGPTDVSVTYCGWNIDDVVVTGETLDPDSILYSRRMDSNPGWTLGTGWAWGQPTGGAGDHGAPDPTSGFSGPNVVGFNLNGGYAALIPSTRWATTPAIDCRNRKNIKLTFYRWLGIEPNTYDHAYIQVSNGTTWTTIWENGTDTIDDGSWKLMNYDITSIAAGKSAVRIRFGLGPTDEIWQYCGWNIDDFLVTGDPENAVEVNWQDYR